MLAFPKVHSSKCQHVTFTFSQQPYFAQYQRAMSTRSAPHLNLNKPARLTMSPVSNAIFRMSRAARDWHQHLDHQTGKFYYINIFSGEKTDKQPAEFLPYDAPPQDESLAALRSNQFQHQSKPRSVLRPIAAFCVVAAGIAVAEHFGLIDRLFGFTPPQRPPATLAPDVYQMTKQKMVSFRDFKEEDMAAQ